jgi:hypothetical protein
MQRQRKRKQNTKTKSASSGSEGSAAKSRLQSLPTAEKTSGSSQSDERTQAKNDNIEPSNPALTAEEFDRRFDEGESIFALGVGKTGWTRPDLETKRFNVDLPAHMLRKLDDAALVRGITRQALVKTWLFDRLVQETKADRV